LQAKSYHAASCAFTSTSDSSGLAGGNFEQPPESLEKTTPNFVLVSKKSSTYLTREKICSDTSGWVGEDRYAFGVFRLRLR
jgi:hypothetical protein